MLGVALRVGVMYVYALVAMHLAGKREINQLSVPDAAAAFIVGDLFDDAIWAEVPLAQALVAFGCVVAAHIAVSYGVYRSPALDKLVEGTPTLMVRAGELLSAGLRKEHFRPRDVESQLRLKAVDDVRELKVAYQEPGNHMSALPKEEHKDVQKRDLPELEALLR